MDKPRVLVLAGGLATRLCLSHGTPKFLAPLRDGYRFADAQMKWLREQGFKEVILSIGHGAPAIEEYCGDGSKFGLEITYTNDGLTPLGTGGATRRALLGLEGPSVIIYGDTLLEMDVDAALSEMRDSHALMTVMKCPEQYKPNASLDGARVTYNKSNPQPEWQHIDYGLLVLSPDFVDELPGIPNDLADTLAGVSRFGWLSGYEATKPFFEINTPEQLAKLQEE